MDPLPHSADFWSLGHDDHPHDECGIFGVHSPGEQVANTIFFGLFALQHRGQESAGISVSDGREIRSHRRMGLVSQVFDHETIAWLRGHLGIGHTRYSTTGSSVIGNAQPLEVETPYGRICVAHNGNIVNTRELRAELQHEGIRFTTTNDSEVIAQCIASLHRGDLVNAVRETMERVRGAYSVLILTEDKMIAIRDPHGVRPLCLGELDGGGAVVSSETCALHVVGARFLREIDPGELIVIDRESVIDYQAVQLVRNATCVFEFIYLARPDSHIYGKNLHLARRKMGQQLFQEHPVEAANLVIPVPDTGIPAAIGFSEASHIPFGEGLIKNRYIGRTFIEPDQRMRELGVRMKLSALRENLYGRKVVMVDDSIVRGTTTGQIVRLLRDAGAAEVHVRISSPPVQWPCFYGVDMADRHELIAARMSTDEIREHIGANSLGYLSMDGVHRAIGMGKGQFCTACFTGKYPISVPRDLKNAKFALEELDEGIALASVAAHQG